MLAFDGVHSALFKGVEQEGPLKGCHTLFVYGLVDRADIEEAMEEYDLYYVYFGAGGLSPYNEDDVDYFWRLGFYVTVEAIEKPARHAERDLKYFWMCPIMWHGAVVYTKTMQAVRQLADLSPRERRHTLVKLDTGSATLVAPLASFATSQYGDYGGDVLLKQTMLEPITLVKDIS